MRLYIKNMYSHRCEMVVKTELNNIGFQTENLVLGSVDIPENITLEQYHKLKNSLFESGLELVDLNKTILVGKIKNTLNELLCHLGEDPNTNVSQYLVKHIGYNYNYLSHVFTEVTEGNIEHYLITNKIEMVKELLLYNEMNITEISYKLNYSSVAHLSNQFKKMTGLRPSYFKCLNRNRSNVLQLA